MGFEKGKSGNPKGRPKGIPDKRTALRELLEPHAEALVNKAVEMAKNGDTTALRICIERLIPPIRAKSEVALLEGLEGKTLTEQGAAMIEAMGRGDLGPDEAASMLKALAAQSQISKIDELAERISKLETRR